MAAWLVLGLTAVVSAQEPSVAAEEPRPTESPVSVDEETREMKATAPAATEVQPQAAPTRKPATPKEPSRFPTPVGWA
ncbi:MAG: hypothetical protein AB2A00_30125, partial [Myxococcota bacterium]